MSKKTFTCTNVNNLWWTLVLDSVPIHSLLPAPLKTSVHYLLALCCLPTTLRGPWAIPQPLPVLGFPESLPTLSLICHLRHIKPEKGPQGLLPPQEARIAQSSSASSESAGGPQTRDSSETTGKHSSAPITRPVPQCNECLLHLDLETIPVHLHPFLILRILLAAPHLLLVLPLHFLVFLMLNPPVFLVLNPPIFLMLNLAIALMVILAVGLLLGPPAQAATWSPQPPSHTSSHTFGNSPFFGDFDREAEFSGLDHQRENLVILDPPNPNDGNPDVEDDDSVAEEGDTAQIKSQGGPFTDEQVAEIRGIVESMNLGQALESVMRIRNLAISTREWQSAGNLWNAYQASYEKDPEPDRPHHKYVEKVIQPAYCELIAEHGGEDSNAWKKKLKELVDQHNASKAAQAFDIVLSPAAMGKAIKQTTKRWKDDLKWMATMNIHGFCGIISSIPDEVASKQNALFTGSPAMKDWLNLSFQKTKQKIPKSMHLMRKEISEELNNLLTPLISRVPHIPWASLPQFLANNKLKIENWVAESEFPMDGPGEPNESNANSANGTSIAGGASGPRKRASQGGASSIGGQSSGTTWGGAGSSVDGVVNGQFSGNAPSGAINVQWTGPGDMVKTSKNTTHTTIP
ncbi:hypothetical protein BS47DRAFT_1361559 [Hydnum rufescens UP504]|uniref:Uncharacterized protein n=1 Tax=Hydnum rufescens UP504 TaxID=1448309 RepID=A0A9P6DUX5_9AGAM|nr:hypothetical protein BS47DRAFT_1361559 [Hydnum rufescens UP504]